MRNKTASTGVREVLARARYEVLPTASIEERLAQSVPTSVRLTVTASPAKGLAASLELVDRLRSRGYDVVPHLAARMISGRSELAEITSRLSAAGVTDVFCPAGDADPPAGDYLGALSLLKDLTELGRPFPNVGVTGYPESHPAIEDDVTIQAMWDKREHATYIVSNMCFDPKAITQWVRRMRKRGIEMPVLLGLPGPVERAKLVAMSTKIGVGQSARFLRTHRGTIARLAAPGGYSPERFLQRCAPLFVDPAMAVNGLHLFTFNQVAETQTWRENLMARAAS